MPILDGIQASRFITGSTFECSHVPKIYALTANLLEKDIIDIKNCGMSGYLCKPLNMNDLKTVLQQALDDKKLKKFH